MTAGTAANAFQFRVNGLQAAASVDTSANTAWNMGYANSANDTISLDIADAKIARVTADISTPQKAATICRGLIRGGIRDGMVPRLSLCARIR